MPELYLFDYQYRAMQRDLESIEKLLSSGNQFLNFGVLEKKYLSPVLVEREGLLPYRDYLEFLAVHLRYCVENGTVPEATQKILQAYKCPYLPHGLTPPVIKTAKVIPLFAEMVN